MLIRRPFQVIRNGLPIAMCYRIRVGNTRIVYYLGSRHYSKNDAVRILRSKNRLKRRYQSSKIR